MPTINVPDPPEGFEYTGEFRIPERGEYFCTDQNVAATAPDNFATRWPRLRKKQLEKRAVWVNVYPAAHEDCYHSSKDKADHIAGRDRIACLKLEYEVPEQG
jgi:hypothetical protein